MRRFRRLSVFLGTTLVVVLAAAGTTRAVVPGENGRMGRSFDSLRSAASS